jgi:UDP-N-acetyl-D-galactosamine dehydrogenase
VPDIIKELREFRVQPLVHDPLADPEEAAHEYGIELTDLEKFVDLDAVVLAVPHQQYLDALPSLCAKLLGSEGGFIDVTAAVDPTTLPKGVHYWAL